MTEGGTCTVAKDKHIGGWRGVISILSIAGVLALAVVLSEDLGKFAREGLKLATERVLPSTLPFMVISALAASLITPESLPHISRLLARIFGISEEGFSALVIGNLTGFPIGSKMTAELYASGRLDTREAECLLAYSSNPSPPFVTAVVGAGLLGDVRLGIILLAALMIGTVLSAQLMRRKYIKMSNNDIILRQKFDFVASVKSAAEASVSMIAFITLFFTASKIAAKLFGGTPISTLIILLSEVTGAVSFVADFAPFGLLSRVGLSAFALGFGGVSVMLQSAAFSHPVGLGLKRYFLIKISEGIFSALAAILLTYLLYL